MWPQRPPRACRRGWRLPAGRRTRSTMAPGWVWGTVWAAGGPAARAVVKPAQTGLAPGEAGDLDEVRRLTGVLDLHEYARYPDPLSPAAAARRAQSPVLMIDDVVRRVRELAMDRQLVIIEGAG